MQKVAFIYNNTNFKNEIEYAATICFQSYNVLLNFFNYSDNLNELLSDYDLKIYYGNEDVKNVDIKIYEGGLFSNKYLKKESVIDKVDFYNNNAIFIHRSNEEYVKFSNETLYYNIDVIQTIFYFLTCYEEYVINEYDENNRFNINKSILNKYNLIRKPVVNENIRLFIDKIEKCFNIKFELKKFWGDKEYGVALTHDVDVVSKYLTPYRELRLEASIFLKNKKPCLAVKRSIEYIKSKIFKTKSDPYDTFDYLIESEKKYNFKSTFYFMGNKKTYDPAAQGVQKIFKKLRSNGFEIGFHPGLGTSANEEKFKEEKDVVLKSISNIDKIGVRQHYLSFVARETWQIQDRNGILYDTSVGYPQCAGFKVGYCLPYKVFDIKEKQQLNVWELPLTVMDGSLIQYMNCNFDEAKNYCKELISQIRRYNGLFVLLWHNSAINEEYCAYSKKLLELLYESFYNDNCFVSNSEAILNKYSKNIR